MANPAMNDAVYKRLGPNEMTGQPMTLQGTVTKSVVLVGILLISGAYSWSQVAAKAPMGSVLLFGGLIGGFILAMITIFAPRYSPITAPIYAACEGCFLGAVSLMYNTRYPGIVTNAVTLSIGVLALMLFAYGTRIIRVTDKFRLGVIVATGAICLVYLVSIVMSFFGAHLPMIHTSGPIGIAFSVFVVIIAAMNLMLNFDFIEKGVQFQAPQYMEWYGGFSLLVTLVWMYLEILRLLSKVRDR